MPRILAIESDPKRRHVLSTLVREHVKATLVVVPSVRAAIASIAERTPDLIIAPTLLSPPDEAELLTHMKGLDSAPYVQMLTVPALDMLADAPADETPPSRAVRPGLQPSTGLAGASVRSRHGGGADRGRPRAGPSAPDGVRDDAGLSGGHGHRWREHVDRSRALRKWAGARASSSARCSGAAARAGPRRAAHRAAEGPRRRPVAVGDQGVVGRRSAADQHLEHRRAGRDRFQVRSRQHDQPAPVRSRDQPRGARALHPQ